MNTLFYLVVCKELIRSDWAVFKQVLLDKCIDIGIWVVLTLLVTVYVMPFFGLSHDFGVFQFGSVVATVGLFELYTSAIDLVSDFERDRIINYNLTLPIPSWLTMLSKAIYYFLVYVTLTLIMLPIGALVLWRQLDFAHIIYAKLLLIVCTQSIFYACFTLWVSSLITNMAKLGNVWSRFIFPMWFMGGFQFSWTALHKVLPRLACVNLINPMIYITEAVRIALLGQNDYINFWICLAAIMFFSILCFIGGFYNLKKRLDFV